MKLAELKKKGGFVPVAPVPQEIEWEKDGETLKFKVFVKRQSFGTIERLFTDDDDRSRSAAYISATIRLGDDAKEEMTYEDAYQLEPSLAAAFMRAINEVNGTGKGEPKN